MANKPFFSIVIPTYNRTIELKIAIDCIISQKFTNFEIIVIDNAPTDETSKVVKLFRDKRIRLVVNRKNLGWIVSVQKGLDLARGEYIVLQGDDDYMFLDTLKNLKELIDKNNFGYIRLNYLSYLTWRHELVDFKMNKKNIKNTKISPNSSNEDILEFIEKTDPFFITGIVFKNNYPKNLRIINSELSPWLRIIFFNTYNSGGYFSSRYSFISSWRKKDNNSGHPFYRLGKNKFTFEQYLNQAKKITKEKENDFLNRRLKQVILLFPANKHSTNNSNLIICARRVLELSPKLKFSPFFWFWFLFAFFSPKILLGLMRELFFIRLIKAGIQNKLDLAKENILLDRLKTV